MEDELFNCMFCGRRNFTFEQLQEHIVLLHRSELETSKSVSSTSLGTSEGDGQKRTNGMREEDLEVDCMFCDLAGVTVSELNIHIDSVHMVETSSGSGIGGTTGGGTGGVSIDEEQKNKAAASSAVSLDSDASAVRDEELPGEGTIKYVGMYGSNSCHMLDVAMEMAGGDVAQVDMSTCGSEAEGEGRQACPMCGATFSISHELQDHVNLHFDERNNASQANSVTGRPIGKSTDEEVRESQRQQLEERRKRLKREEWENPSQLPITAWLESPGQTSPDHHTQSPYNEGNVSARFDGCEKSGSTGRISDATARNNNKENIGNGSGENGNIGRGCSSSGSIGRGRANNGRSGRGSTGRGRAYNGGSNGGRGRGRVRNGNPDFGTSRGFYESSNNGEYGNGKAPYGSNRNSSTYHGSTDYVNTGGEGGRRGVNGRGSDDRGRRPAAAASAERQQSPAERPAAVRSCPDWMFDSLVSCTRDVTQALKTYYMRHGPAHKSYWLASTTDHFSTHNQPDRGFGCGYRNLQMIISCLMHSLPYQTTLFNGNIKIPSVTKIQSLIESAWRKGFDQQGSAQLDGQLLGTRKWIGATEIVTLLSSLYVRCQLVDFHAPSDPIAGTHPDLFRWVRRYFEERKNAFCPPLYLQHQGHSRLIVGYDETKEFDPTSAQLLILDPGCPHFEMLKILSGDQMKSSAESLMFRLNALKRKQYQIVAVLGVIQSHQQYEDSKQMRSERT